MATLNSAPYYPVNAAFLESCADHSPPSPEPLHQSLSRAAPARMPPHVSRCTPQTTIAVSGGAVIHPPRIGRHGSRRLNALRRGPNPTLCRVYTAPAFARQIGRTEQAGGVSPKTDSPLRSGRSRQAPNPTVGGKVLPAPALTIARASSVFRTKLLN